MPSRLPRPAASIFPALAGLLATLALAPAQLAPRPAAPPTPQPAPPPKLLDEEAAAKLLAQLDDVSKTMEEKKYGYNAGIIRDLRDASSSSDKAFNLWLDCMKFIEFDEKGRSATEFAEWKRNQTKNGNRERDMRLQLEVQWLTVVVMDANARTESARAEVVAAASAYLDSLLALLKKNDGRGAPNGDVVSSVFGRRYKLDITVGRKENGATHDPGSIGGIYETVIFPYYRRNKMATSLMQAWTRRIAHESDAAATAGFAEAREKFEQERLPQLKWGQMKEMFELGQQETAAPAMVSHIRTNMAHRDAPRWIDDLRLLLAGEDKSVAPQRTEATIPPTPDSAPAPVVEPSPHPTTPGPVVDPAPEAAPAPATTPPRPAAPTPRSPATADPTPVENPFPGEEPLRDPTKADPAL